MKIDQKSDIEQHTIKAETYKALEHIITEKKNDFGYLTMITEKSYRNETIETIQRIDYENSITIIES